MSTPEAARRKMLKPNGFVHRARAWALHANVICRGGDFFQCRRPVLAHVKPRTENVAAACFVQVGPSLDKLMCGSLLHFHAHS